MTFSRRWLLIFSALLLGGGQLAVAASREERAYGVALGEFHDGFYDQAQTHLAQFVLRYPKSTNVASAVLFRVQAQYQLGRYGEAMELLTSPTNLAKARVAGLADRYADWLAQAQFVSGDYVSAAHTWVALTEDFPRSSLCLRAVVAAATAYGLVNDWPQVDALLTATNGILIREQLLNATNELVLQGNLLHAQSQNEQTNFAAGLAILAAMPRSALNAEQQWLHASLKYQNRDGSGEADEAVAAATNLVQVARSQKNAARLATANAALAAALKKKQQLAAAIQVWSENLNADAPAGEQREAVLKIAELAIAQNDFSQGVASLELFLKQYAGGPATELAWLTLGELHLKKFVTQLPGANADSNELFAAQSAYDQLLANTHSPLAAQAFLGRGWSLWLAGKTAESLADFRAAAKGLPHSEAQAVAKFKAGDALFAGHEFAAARQQYQAVLDEFADLPAVAQSLGDRALYQILRADLQEQKVAEADTVMRRLLQQFPTSELNDKSLLLTGEAEGFSDFAKPDQARAIFQQFARQFPDSPLKSQVAFAVARTFERKPDWSAAVTNYENWLKDFPADPLLPEVKFALATAQSQAGNDADAFRLFSAFVTEFPAHELAPQAQWWVADHYFVVGGTNWGLLAETSYENIYQNTNAAWQNSSLVYPAQLMAGRVAMARFSYTDAAKYFLPLTTNESCPEAIRWRAQLAYAQALMQSDVTDTNKQMAYYQAATNQLLALCRLAATNEAGALAWSEIGGASLQMNDLAAATNAFMQVLDSPAASVGLRQRAQVGLGLVLEKMAEAQPPEARPPLIKQAWDNYFAVFYSKDDQADAFWVKEAGLKMWDLAPKIGDLDKKTLNKFVDRMEEKFPPLKNLLEQKRAILNAGEK